MMKMKNKIAALIAMSMAAATIPVYAAERAVTITPKSVIASSKLTAKVDPASDDLTYQWLSADGEEGPFKPIYKADGKQYIYSTIDKNKYITVEATDKNTGETVRSNDVRSAAKLGPVGAVSLQRNATPAENIFCVDGQKFILLDEFQDSASAFYVMAEGVYGEKEFDTDSSAVFDVQSDKNIGYFLNNDFLAQGNEGKTLPQGIIDNIDTGHVWWTEAGMTDGDCAEDYSVVCGVNLLSMSEAVKYQGLFGCAPEGAQGGWWLRTQRGRSGSADNILSITGTESGVEQNKMADVFCGEKKGVRPVFYLGENFFLDVKIDVYQSGQAIKDMLASEYTKSDLEGMYSTEELIEIGFPSEPGTVIKGAYIAGAEPVGAGTTLTAGMDVSGAEEYQYQWLTSREPEAGYTEIRNATDAQYYITTQDKNCYISCRVTPVRNGEKMEADTAAPVFVETLGYMKERAFSKAEKEAAMVTPEENKFSLDGSDRTYILLDSFNGSAEAEFFVMADYLTGPIEADAEDPGLFLPDKKGNIAYWLNNNYKETGYEIAGIHKDGIEKEFLDYVDMNHEWWCESGIEGRKDTTGDYSYTGPFSVLSYSEGIKYYGTYGWQSATEHGGWNLHYWTRTSSDSTDSFFCMLNGAGVNDSTGSYNIRHVPPIAGGHEEVTPRPVFYLSHEFFLKANLSYVGENVKKAIRQSYSVQEFLDAGYTLEKLKDLGWVDIPEVENVKISGAARVGAQLAGKYNYVHTKPEKDSKCGFEISDKRDGAYTKVCDGTIYNVKPEDKSKFIRFFVQPHDSDAVAGETEYTQPVYILKSAEVIPLREEIVSADGGEKINSIAKASQIRPDVVLKNTASTEKTVTVMLWLYDRNNTAIKNQAAKVVIGAGETVNIAEPVLSVGKVSDGSYARLYVIDNLSDMTAILTHCVEVK